MITYLVDFILTCSIFFTFFYYDFPFAAKISKFKDASNMNNIWSISIFQLFQHNLKAVFREGFYVLVRLKATEEAKMMWFIVETSSSWAFPHSAELCRNRLHIPFITILSHLPTAMPVISDARILSIVLLNRKVQNFRHKWNKLIQYISQFRNDYSLCQDLSTPQPTTHQLSWQPDTPKEIQPRCSFDIA